MRCVICLSDDHTTHMHQMPYPDFGDTTQPIGMRDRRQREEARMIKPTIGRVVWFWPNPDSPQGNTDGQPLPALICHVWGDTCVNIAGFDANGNPFKHTSVTLYQGDSDRPKGHFAEWMPYQIGQAAKHEGAGVGSVDIGKTSD